MKTNSNIISAFIITTGIGFGVLAGASSSQLSQPEAATSRQEHYQLHDFNIFSKKTTYYNIHYYSSPKKMLLKNQVTYEFGKGWNYKRFKHEWIYY